MLGRTLHRMGRAQEAAAHLAMAVASTGIRLIVLWTKNTSGF